MLTDLLLHGECGWQLLIQIAYLDAERAERLAEDHDLVALNLRLGQLKRRASEESAHAWYHTSLRWVSDTLSRVHREEGTWGPQLAGASDGGGGLEVERGSRERHLGRPASTKQMKSRA
eukprot:2343651-Rhodomonas_salina.1